MKIESLYDQGTAEIQEDRIIIHPPFFGVADGVSGIYLPEEGPKKFNGMSGGEMAAVELLRCVASATKKDELKDVIERARVKIAHQQADEKDPAYMPGTVFALTRVGNEVIEILQCGDCFVLWETISGVGVTENQTFRHDAEALEIIAELMQKHCGNREKMWQEFLPILAEMRRRDINKPGGYGLLNDQPEATKFFVNFSLPRKEIKTLLLFSDGLVPYPETEPGNEQVLGDKILQDFHNGGLDAILEKTRKWEESQKKTSHIDHAEASALAITF